MPREFGSIVSGCGSEEEFQSGFQYVGTFSGWHWCRHFSWELVLDGMAAGVLGKLGNDAVLLVGFTTQICPFSQIDPSLSLALQDHHEQYHHL